MVLKREEEDVEALFSRIAHHYTSHSFLLLVTSLVFFFSFLIPFLIPAPTFLALGAVELRILDLKHLAPTKALFLALAYVFSLFLFSLATTCVYLIIKSKRVLTPIPREVVEGIWRYAWKVFFVYLSAFLLSSIIVSATFGTSFEWLGLFASLLIFIVLFFIPPAVVIDDYSVSRAVLWSAKLAFRFWIYVLTWVVGVALVLMLSEWVLFAVFSPELGKYMVSFVNAFFFLPFFTFLQAEIYLSAKHPLAPPRMH